MSHGFRYLLTMMTTATTVATPLGCGDDLPDEVFTTAPGTMSNDSRDDRSDNDNGDIVDPGEGGDDLDDTAGTTDTGDETGPAADGAPCAFDEEIGDEYEFPDPPEAAEARLRAGTFATSPEFSLKIIPKKN